MCRKLTIFSTFIYISFILVSLMQLSEEALKCITKDFGWGSFACVCNATYCDDIGKIEPIADGYVTVYTSSKTGLRFDRQKKKINSCRAAKTSQESENIKQLQCSFNTNQLKQSIIGFGGSFTDSAGININSLSEAAKTKLMSSYFSNHGIEYTLCRVPMGSTDFSTHFYTYQDDPNEPFQLATEDLVDKIPLIKMANSMSDRLIRHIGSPWGSPLWMREERSIKVLKYSSYQAWADYFINFIKAYKNNGIPIWGITVQNEPFFATFLNEQLTIPNVSSNFMAYTLPNFSKFTIKFLNPTLKSLNYTDVKLMVFDDVLNLLPIFNIFSKPLMEDCPGPIDGFAFHFYYNKYMNYNTTLSGLHNACPERFLISTEACVGVQQPIKVKLGHWENAEEYAHDILKDLQNWVGGWIDWNLALDVSGGPNWINNFVDSPIIVNATEDIFYKQPMFYALGHFSKFIPPGFRIIDISCLRPDQDIEMVAAISENEDSNIEPFNIVVVILNRGEKPKSVNLELLDAKSSLCLKVPAKAIQTYIWNL